jgi:hypothetical protein
MITQYEDISKATFRRVSVKTLDHFFLSQVEKGARCPPFVSSAILEVAKRVYNLHSRKECQDQLTPGQYRAIGILNSEPAGKALEDCRKGECIITLDAGQEDREIRARHGIAALRRARLLRICSEACEQGIHLSHEDIAYNVLNCSLRTVARDVQYWREKGIFVPTRGQQKDIGPGLSHKVMAVKLWLERHHPVEIARRLYHSLKAVERYTECFARVITLHEQGLNLTEIAFVIQISEALSQQYLDLYYQYNTTEYRQRLDEIIGKARGGLSFSKDPGTPKKSEKEVQ